MCYGPYHYIKICSIHPIFDIPNKGSDLLVFVIELHIQFFPLRSIYIHIPILIPFILASILCIQIILSIL